MLLIGIVKKNAIMMIDFALEAERDEGLSPQEAIHKACLLRFRPIMMTTHGPRCSAAFPSRSAAEPAPSCGGRSASRSSAGLIVSQVLTLYTTPVIYLYMERIGRWLKSFGKSKGPADPKTPAEAVEAGTP